MPLVPIVIERSGREERAMDIYSRLLQDRIIILGSAIDDNVSNLIVAQMLVLAHQDAKADIHLYVNSPGGSVTAGLAIYDTMQFIECPVATYCIGLAASGAAVLLAGGSKGRRYCLPHSKVMIHQPYGQVGGQISDIEIQAEEIVRSKHVINEILARHTGQPIERVARDTERDRYLSAIQAKEYGLVDEVVGHMPSAEAAKSSGGGSSSPPSGPGFDAPRGPSPASS